LNNGILFSGDTVNVTLVFGPEVELRGKVIDENGKPLAGVRIQSRPCEQESRQDNTAWLILWVAPVMTTTSDSQGSFRFTGLPQRELFRLHAECPGYASLEQYANTQNLDAKEPKPPDLKLTLVALRRVTTNVMYSDTGKPAANVRVEEVNGSGGRVSGVTDSNGKVELEMPPGDHFLQITPPQGSVYARAYDAIHVANVPAFQNEQLRLRRGCELVLQAIDEKTGMGISGVSFKYWLDNGDTTMQWRPLLDKTDVTGRLSQLVSPGTGRYKVDPTADYEAAKSTSAELDLPAGKTVTVEFKLRKK
jgi:hypothetical protein